MKRADVESSRAFALAPVNDAAPSTHGRRWCSSHLYAVLAVIFGACVVSACTPAASPSRSLFVLVTDDDARPLPHVGIEIDGIAATRTGRDGSVRISLASEGGARARILARCPAGTREAEPRHVARSVSGAPAALQLTFVCLPALRNVVVVVRAPGAEGLWLRADGLPVGRVAPDGTLHAIVSRAPESDLTLVLDTGTLPVVPRNPALALRVGDRDELVVFDQALRNSRGGKSARRTVHALRGARQPGASAALAAEP
jgi:hypothetical protein